MHFTQSDFFRAGIDQKAKSFKLSCYFNKKLVFLGPLLSVKKNGSKIDLFFQVAAILLIFNFFFFNRKVIEYYLLPQKLTEIDCKRLWRCIGFCPIGNVWCAR